MNETNGQTTTTTMNTLQRHRHRMRIEKNRMNVNMKCALENALLHYWSYTIFDRNEAPSDAVEL